MATIHTYTLDEMEEAVRRMVENHTHDMMVDGAEARELARMLSQCILHERWMRAPVPAPKVTRHKDGTEWVGGEQV